MTTLHLMNRDQFCKRLTNLCLRSGLGGMPKDEADQHILLKSAALLLPAGTLSEKDVTERLQVWLSEVCVIKNFDRVTLRRWLVDSGYLLRSSNGASYQVAEPAGERFDASVNAVDVIETIRAAREEMEERKRAFLAKAKGA